MCYIVILRFSCVIYAINFFLFLPPLRRRLCDQVCHSVYVQPYAKSYAWIYMKFFLMKVRPSLSCRTWGDFISEVIWIDYHCHLDI